MTDAERIEAQLKRIADALEENNVLVNKFGVRFRKYAVINGMISNQEVFRSVQSTSKNSKISIAEAMMNMIAKIDDA